LARIFPIAILFSTLSCAHGGKEAPFYRTEYHTLGDTRVGITVHAYPNEGNHVFVQLHDNETTAEAVTTDLLRTEGGMMVQVENNGQRLLRFGLGGREYRFDPNRIFTDAGIRKSLQLYGPYSAEAHREVSGLARALLKTFPKQATVIAVHNNTDGAYSVASYRGSRRKDAAAVHLQPGMDSDDFIYSTDSLLFDSCRKAGFNAVLQHNQAVEDDGSLSVYFGRLGGRYVNIEAQHGHEAVQRRMIVFLLRILEGVPAGRAS